MRRSSILRGRAEQICCPAWIASLEMEPQFYCLSTRRDEMRAAERGEDIKRRLVSEIDDRKSQAPFVALSVEEVIVPNGGIANRLRCLIGTINKGEGLLRCGSSFVAMVKSTDR